MLAWMQRFWCFKKYSLREGSMRSSNVQGQKDTISLSFILRYQSDNKVAVFMHPHPRNPKHTIYWEGPSMNNIDVKGHVVLSETPILELILEKWAIQEQKRKGPIRDLHFRIKMPLPELIYTRHGLTLRVKSADNVLWHCDSFNMTLQPYDFLQAVILLKKMLPLDPDTPDYCYSYSTSAASNFRVFSIAKPSDSKRMMLQVQGKKNNNMHDQ